MTSQQQILLYSLRPYGNTANTNLMLYDTHTVSSKVLSRDIPGQILSISNMNENIFYSAAKSFDYNIREKIKVANTSIYHLNLKTGYFGELITEIPLVTSLNVYKSTLIYTLVGRYSQVISYDLKQEQHTVIHEQPAQISSACISKDMLLFLTSINNEQKQINVKSLNLLTFEVGNHTIDQELVPDHIVNYNNHLALFCSTTSTLHIYDNSNKVTKLSIPYKSSKYPSIDAHKKEIYLTGTYNAPPHLHEAIYFYNPLEKTTHLAEYKKGNISNLHIMR